MPKQAEIEQVEEPGAKAMRAPLGPQPGRPEASRVVWRWDEPASAGSGRGLGAIRLRAVLRSALVAGIAALMYLYVSQHAGMVVGSIAGIVLLAGLLSPTGVFAALERGVGALGILLGRLAAFIALPTVYFCVFLPFSVLFRRKQRDAMRRFYEPELESYWSDRDSIRTASSDRTKLH